MANDRLAHVARGIVAHHIAKKVDNLIIGVGGILQTLHRAHCLGAHCGGLVVQACHHLLLDLVPTKNRLHERPARRNTTRLRIVPGLIAQLGIVGQRLERLAEDLARAEARSPVEGVCLAYHVGDGKVPERVIAGHSQRSDQLDQAFDAGVLLGLHQNAIEQVQPLLHELARVLVSGGERQV